MGTVDVPELRCGVAVGAVVVLAVWLLVATVPPLRAARRRGAQVPLGLVLPVAAWTCLAGSVGVPGTVLVGVGAVALATGLAGRARSAWWSAPLLVLPGAWVVGVRGLDAPGWVEATVVAGVVVGAPAASAFDRRWHAESLALPLLALSAAGAFFAVPDTEQIAAVAGVAISCASLWPWRAARLGAAGAGATVAAVVWAAAAGSTARPASLVGAVACLGVLVGAPIGRALLPRVPSTIVSRPRAIALLLASHAILVLVASRVAGLRETTWSAVAVAAPVAVAAVLLGAWFASTSDGQLDAVDQRPKSRSGRRRASDVRSSR